MARLEPKAGPNCGREKNKDDNNKKTPTVYATSNVKF